MPLDLVALSKSLPISMLKALLRRHRKPWDPSRTQLTGTRLKVRTQSLLHGRFNSNTNILVVPPQVEDSEDRVNKLRYWLHFGMAAVKWCVCVARARKCVLAGKREERKEKGERGDRGGQRRTERDCLKVFLLQ